MILPEPRDITAPLHKADPWAWYARGRAEAPVCRIRVQPGDRKAFLVLRYDDVAALLRDPRFAKDPANALTPEQLRRERRPPAFLAPLTRNMLALDDPDHARLKRLVQKAFTLRSIEALAPRTEAIAERLLDGLRGRAGFDLVKDFALPLPVTVISDLLGVPEADRARFAGWSRTLITTPQRPLPMLLALPRLRAFVRYLRRLVASKRAAPADDLVSALVAAEALEGEGLTGEELLAMVAILLSAGHETTANLIGNGTLALLRHPGQLERLRAEPSLAESAVEELLRFESPADTTTHRYAREELEIAGARIPRGALVFGAIASANRDDARFPDAGRLDLGRTPNRHLAFGAGAHFCVGAALARMEGRVALAALARHLPNLRLRDKPAWRGGLVLRGMTQLPVAA